MRFEGMIFDIEGTLIDCIPQNLSNWQETLCSFGATVSIETLQRYSGKDALSPEFVHSSKPSSAAGAR